MTITVQQYANTYSFIIFSADGSTCFGWYPHPSSGGHSNCNYNIWHWSKRVSSETCRAVCRKYNKTVYRCILLDNYWDWFTMHGPMNIKLANLCYNRSTQSANFPILMWVQVIFDTQTCGWMFLCYQYHLPIFSKNNICFKLIFPLRYLRTWQWCCRRFKFCELTHKYLSTYWRHDAPPKRRNY